MTQTSEIFQQAITEHRAGRFVDAERLYQNVLRLDPGHADALHLLGVSAHQSQRHAEAVEYIGRAITLNGRQAAYHSNLGAAYRALGHVDDAVKSFKKAVELAPHQAEFQFNLGNAYRQQGHLSKACDAYLQSLAENPNYADAHNNLANVLKERGELSRSADHYCRVLEINPDHPEAHLNLGRVRLTQGRIDEAMNLFQTALRLKPDLAEGHNSLGMAFQRRGHLDEAVAHYQEALHIRPEYREAQNNLGTALLDQGMIAEALALFQRVVDVEPANCEARTNLANARKAAGQLDEAIACLEQVIRDRADFALAHNNLGNCWKEKGDIQQSLECYTRAVELAPDFAEAHANLALLLQNEGEIARALAHYNLAIKYDPSPRLQIQSATLLPPIYSSMENLLYWRNRLERQVSELLAQGLTVDPIERPCETTFYLPYQGFDDRKIQEQIGRLHRSPHELPRKATRVSRRAQTDKIRIGFISRYLHNHTIGRLMRGTIALLSRDDFEVTVISAGRKEDEISRFVRDAADRHIEIANRISASRSAILDLDLDILYFTDIGMDPITYSLAHTRLADVQCATWGHPITTGLPTIDYFVSSRLFEIDDADGHYSEALVRLESPGVYYYRPEPFTRAVQRRAFGLPDDKHLYGCPQSLFKLHLEFDLLLGEILRRDPQGELVLLSGSRPNWNRLTLERLVQSIPDVVDRVRFVPRQNYEGFLKLNMVFDVLLDPLHFSGGNTSYEAFAFGVPIVTLPSPFLRGRITQGLYQQMNFMDCIAATPEDYVQKAVALATNAEYRHSVQDRILGSAGRLYEDLAAIRELEQFFRRVMGRSAPLQ